MPTSTPRGQSRSWKTKAPHAGYAPTRPVRQTGRLLLHQWGGSGTLVRFTLLLLSCSEVGPGGLRIAQRSFRWRSLNCRARLRVNRTTRPLPACFKDNGFTDRQPGRDLLQKEWEVLVMLQAFRVMSPNAGLPDLRFLRKNRSDGTCTHLTLLARQHRPCGTCAPFSKGKMAGCEGIIHSVAPQ